ncbi:PhnA domain-containing protein [bacterium]|nr:PhnA domain-containing protein [bacterium]
MSLSLNLESRCEMKCELCGNNEGITALPVSPKSGDNDDDNVVVCPKCAEQIQNTENLDTNHLRCLAESIWSQVPAVQAITYRLLSQMPNEGWAQDTIGMAYLDEETLEWAQTGDSKLIHKDSNGNILQAGDSVTLIQDLNVKGANFTAKRGTAVRRIRLVHDNAEHIEGKVDGQHIVILTKFVKKS